MSANNSSHGASKKEMAKNEAQKARARQALPKPAIAPPSMPLFDGPKKVQANALDHTSQKIQQVLGNYNEVRPFFQDSTIIGVSSQPSTPLVTDPKVFFPGQTSYCNNGQHKPTESSLPRKMDRPFNHPASSHSSKESATGNNSRKSHFPVSTSHPSHDRSNSRSPVKVPPFSHSSPVKKNLSRPNSSPSSQRSKMSLESYRAGLSSANQKQETSTHSSHSTSVNSISPPDHNSCASSQNSKSSSQGIKGPQTPPNGTISDHGKLGHRNNQLKLIIPDKGKTPDILDEIFNEMTIQPPLTGIQTPRKTEDKFPFPTQKTSSSLSLNSSSESLKEHHVKSGAVNKNLPNDTHEIKPKTDLADRKPVAMKPNKIKREQRVSSSSESSSGSSSESGSDSDSNNSDEDEGEKKEEKSEEKEEVRKELDKSVDSTSSTESQPSQPRWNLHSYIEKPKTSPLSQMSTNTKQVVGSKIDDENDALLDEMVKSIPGKKLEDIGPSATLPFDIRSMSDEDEGDDVTLVSCDMDRFQNGAHSDDVEKSHRNNCSPSTLSTCSSNASTHDNGKSAEKHKLSKRRRSSSNKSTVEKLKKDSKSSKKSNSSDINLKPPEIKIKDEKKRKSLSNKRKKAISREIIDTDSDIDVDVVSVTPESKLSTPMSSILSDHNQNDKPPFPKQLFTSPKQTAESTDSKLNNSQSSSGSKTSRHRHRDRNRDVEHKKILYKQNHINNVKKIKPQNYNTSDEDESTDCGQEVEDILESTEDFRPPSLHSPLPPCPYPCKDLKSPPTDTKSLISLDSSITPVKSSTLKTTKSPPKLECVAKCQKVNHVQNAIVVKINLSLIKKLQKDSQSALKKLNSEDPKPVKVKKEIGIPIHDKSPESKYSEISVAKDPPFKKSIKMADPLDDTLSKKGVANGTKSSPNKVHKKDSDTVKSSLSIKSETESISTTKKSASSKLGDSATVKDPDIKKESDSTHSKKDSRESKDSVRTKDVKPHKRKSESSLTSESAKKHKSSSKSSSSSSNSSSTINKRSSTSNENGIDGETEEEKRPSSRTERRNSSSSTSSRHSSKSQLKKPKLESKAGKESTSDRSSKKEIVVENGENHLPFSNYTDDITASPVKTTKSQNKPSSLSIEEADQADHYLSRAKELKHKADTQKDKPVQLITYTEAVLAFIQCGNAMERKKISEPLKIFTMYTETLTLLKSICRFRHDQSSQDKKLSVLILRIQSLLCLKLYYLKKTEALKFKKIIEQHEQNKVSKPSHAPSPHQGWNNRSSGIPSPMSPTPSPAGSIGSVGSQGSCDLSASKVTNGTSLTTVATPMASPGSVSVPQRIHSVNQQYFTISCFLVSAMEYWDLAEQSAAEFPQFFDHLNKVVSRLLFTPSFPQLITYVQKGLQCLKESRDT